MPVAIEFALSWRIGLAEKKLATPPVPIGDAWGGEGTYADEYGDDDISDDGISDDDINDGEDSDPVGPYEDVI
jgi:hypothetical protein